MPEFSLAYGKGHLSFVIPEGYSLDVISPEETPGAVNPIESVELAIQSPIGEFSFSNFQDAKSAAIAVNDKTRPVPHEILLPPLLQKLASLGIPKSKTYLIIATGTHTPMPSDEFSRVIPEDILREYPVISHDCDAAENLTSLGTTQSGTPVQVNSIYHQADLKIVVGNIEPHHFMGFSGGVKSASIGLTGRETINKNHAFLSHPKAVTAEYHNNPMRQDVEEIGEKIGVHLAINTILNHKKQIVEVFAGSPKAVMLAGIPKARQICQVNIPQPYDLVIASPGGHPKDINFYQAQKGLTHAAMLTRDGGTVILVAACPEGPGSASYMEWMAGINSFQDVFERFSQEGFRVGPHKAYQVARIATRVRVILVTDMTKPVTDQMLLESYPDMGQALSAILLSKEKYPRIVVLPQAVATIPHILNSSSMH